MKNLTLENITKAVGGTYFGPSELLHKEIADVTTDSRKAGKDSLFIPIKGERVDGNSFIPQVFEQGALVCFREEPLENYPYILVENVLQAIKDLAEFYRMQFSIPVIGITGSVGKTSTKEMVASVLSTHYKVLKTQGNFNNELGLPLTIFNLREEHEVAILEMGMSDFGEMERLSKIARPNHCIITNIGCCHLENCGDRDGVLRAKSEIFTYWQKDGEIFLNGDDDKLITIKQVEGKVPVWCGLHNMESASGETEHKNAYAYDLKNQGLKGYTCNLHLKTMDVDVAIPQPGIHMVSNAVVAAAVGETFGLTAEEIRQGIAGFKPVGDRGKMIETEKYLIISDCYNANPVSMKAGIDVMKDALGRKVCILGDMFELGAQERELHHEVGAYAKEAGMDLLICVGNLTEEMVKGAAGMETAHFATVEAAKAGLEALLKQGDTILVKASHGMHLEQLTEYLENL